MWHVFFYCISTSIILLICFLLIKYFDRFVRVITYFRCRYSLCQTINIIYLNSARQLRCFCFVFIIVCRNNQLISNYCNHCFWTDKLITRLSFAGCKLSKVWHSMLNQRRKWKIPTFAMFYNMLGLIKRHADIHWGMKYGDKSLQPTQTFWDWTKIGSGLRLDSNPKTAEWGKAAL